MEPISPLVLYSVGIEYQKIYHLLSMANEKFPADSLVVAEDCEKLHSIMGPSYEQLTKLNCPGAAKSSLKPGYLMQDNKLTYGVLSQILSELDGRIRDEIEECYAFGLTHAEAALFDPKEPILGPQVALNFESASFDIEEAGKCHALGRSTAAVFHAFRTLEIGIKAVARCLSVPGLEQPKMQNWGKILEAVEGAIKERWPGEKQRDTGDGELFWDVYTQMLALKVPRNGTMHPARKYTEQEADRMLRIVGDIMIRLATRIDENGLPRAPKRRRSPAKAKLA